MSSEERRKADQPAGKIRRGGTKGVVAAKIATKPAGSSRTRTARATSGTVIMQARVDANFARALTEQDAVVLGLDGTSALVREGLRLVHERAREAAMIAAYDEFYGGMPAPLPTGVVPADADQ